MPSTDRKLELKAKTSVAQTGYQPYVYAKGLIKTPKLKYVANYNLYNYHVITKLDVHLKEKQIQMLPT
jgi:hypothetical protein